jgi:hypothetical protein
MCPPGTGGPGRSARRPVSRVLSAPRDAGRPFLWDAPHGAPHATNPGGGTGMSSRPIVRPARPPLFCLAPGGVYPATPVTRGAVRSYRTVSPVLAGPGGRAGGLFSVALSLGSPPPAVSRHRIPVEPGLSSTAPEDDARGATAAVRPSGGRDMDGMGRAVKGARPAPATPRPMPGCHPGDGGGPAWRTGMANRHGEPTWQPSWRTASAARHQPSDARTFFIADRCASCSPAKRMHRCAAPAFA